MKPAIAIIFVFAEIASIIYGQGKSAAGPPFTLTWSNGKCLRCKHAVQLGAIQAVSHSEIWGVGSKEVLNALDTIIVHSTDAGRTWNEVPQSQHYTDPDGQLAFSFVGARGWVALWERPSDEPEMISTRDAGQHWQLEARQFLQRMQFLDDLHGYGTVAAGFCRTSDGGRSWVETKIPDIIFIECMAFLTPENGWLAGAHGKNLFVFRTANGGRDWEEFRTTPAQSAERARDLFFLDQQRGWLATWNQGAGGHVYSYLYSTVDGGRHWAADPDAPFQGKGKTVNAVRFTSPETGFVFFLEGAKSKLAYTTDGGANWHEQALPRLVDDCQVFAGDVLCSANSGFRLLTLHPK